jgi:hypothetical protein
MKRVASKLLRSCRMSSWLLLAFGAAFLPALAACIAPLQFEEEHDGGIDQDNAPAILLDSAKPSMLTTATIEEATPPTFSVQVEDKDATDVLYLRVFRDYHVPPPKPYVTDKQAAKPDMNSLTVRTFEIETNTWCQGATTGTQFMFEVLVSDRPFLDLSVEPLFRAVPPGAKTARSYWVATCQ